MYREELGPDGVTLIYSLPSEGGATPGMPAALDGMPVLQPYPALEVGPCVKAGAALCPWGTTTLVRLSLRMLCWDLRRRPLGSTTYVSSHHHRCLRLSQGTILALHCPTACA